MKLSVNRRPAMGNTPIVINDYQKEPTFSVICSDPLNAYWHKNLNFNIHTVTCQKYIVCRVINFLVIYEYRISGQINSDTEAVIKSRIKMIITR